MSIYTTRNVLVLVAAIGFLAVSPVFGGTVATFADPTVDGSTPLFTLSDTELTGGWNGADLKLNLALAGQEFEDATFTMTDLTVTGDVLSAGTIRFFESAADGGDLILQIDFAGGLLLGSTGFTAGYPGDQETTFSGPAITQDLTNEGFTFSFANSVDLGNTTTYTAVFNSSADVDDDDDGDDGDGDGDSVDNDGDDNDGDDGDGNGDDGDDGDDNDGDDSNDNDGNDNNNTGNAGNNSDELEAIAEQLGCGQLCGAGMLPVMPLMLLGLGLMKYRNGVAK